MPLSQFKLFLSIGFDHIMDIRGYDHILFIIVLCTVYLVQDWKRILVLVTAFTIGHSVTLALATLKIVYINTHLVEFLIPITILVTAISNLFIGEGSGYRKGKNWNYFLAIFFGLFHGLGFSSYLRSLMGQDDSIITQLLAFNIGLELGQIVIVLIYMLIAFIFTSIFSINKRTWNLVISSVIAGMSISLIMENNYWQ